MSPLDVLPLQNNGETNNATWGFRRQPDAVVELQLQVQMNKSTTRLLFNNGPLLNNSTSPTVACSEGALGIRECMTNTTGNLFI